jgi:hypothetical protein
MGEPIEVNAVIRKCHECGRRVRVGADGRFGDHRRSKAAWSTNTLMCAGSGVVIALGVQPTVQSAAPRKAAKNVVALTVYGAYHPRDAGNAAGSDHLVVSTDLVSGRLRRAAGDALCKPAQKFWGLYSHPERKPTCKVCLEIARRHGLSLPTPRGDEVTEAKS